MDLCFPGKRCTGSDFSRAVDFVEGLQTYEDFTDAFSMKDSCILPTPASRLHGKESARTLDDKIKNSSLVMICIFSLIVFTHVEWLIMQIQNSTICWNPMDIKNFSVHTYSRVSLLLEPHR